MARFLEADSETSRWASDRVPRGQRVRHLASISRAHRARALPIPCGSELVRAMLRGIKRAHGRTR